MINRIPRTRWKYLLNHLLFSLRSSHVLIFKIIKLPFWSVRTILVLSDVITLGEDKMPFMPKNAGISQHML